MTIDEPGVLDRLIINAKSPQPAATNNAQDGFHPGLVVTQFKVNGDSLVSGAPSASLFAANSTANPQLGHRINSSSKVVVTIKNNHATLALECSVAVCVR
jgi:hypothetical protein